MKIGVLGAAGDMGRGVVDHLRDAGVDVVAADLRRQAVADLAREDGVTAMGLDVRGDDAPARLREADLDAVVGAVGPFYEFGVDALDLAIDAGVPYVDLCDDHDAAEAELRRDDAARAAGVPAVVGCGWTPGLSNLLAARAADRLGDVDAVEIDWIGSAADSDGLAVVMHVFHAMTGGVPQFHDGETVEVVPGADRETVDVPEIGSVTTVACGHPEPVTLPGNLDARDVRLRGALVPEWQNGLVRTVVRTGLTRSPDWTRRLSRLIHRVEGLFAVGGVDRSAVRVSVTGDGGTETYAAVGHMRDLTGRPAAVGARLLADGSYEPGVVAPEAAFEPGPFLDRVGGDAVRLFRRDRGWTRLDDR